MMFLLRLLKTMVTRRTEGEASAAALAEQKIASENICFIARIREARIIPVTDAVLSFVNEAASFFASWFVRCGLYRINHITRFFAAEMSRVPKIKFILFSTVDLALILHASFFPSMHNERYLCDRVYRKRLSDIVLPPVRHVYRDSYLIRITLSR